MPGALWGSNLANALDTLGVAAGEALWRVADGGGIVGISGELDCEGTSSPLAPSVEYSDPEWCS